jgi:hypothetical protein
MGKTLSAYRHTLLAGLVMTFSGHGAAAMEEVLVVGTDLSAETQRSEAAFRSEMRDYVRAINAEQKAILDERFDHLLGKKILIVAASSRARG